MNAVVLDIRSSTDLKLIISLAKKLNINVFSITKQERESIEDLKLLNLMVESKKEGMADKKETLSKLGIEI
ncbi:MAG: hypothetical protein LBG45_10495 [Dysgonamonadaceae bacterium]|jgi:hypothetical protein|nr:hypothetical protein [Dysgonamonadaceae bacterium]